MSQAILTFVGDLFPGNLPYNQKIGIAGKFYSGFYKTWVDQCHKLIGETDFLFANLEAPLIEDKTEAYISTFAGAPDFTKFLIDAGFRTVSIANNHILEHGKDGFMSTIQLLKDNNISAVGLFENGNSNYVIKKINGIRVGMVGYNSINNIPNPKLYAEYKKDLIVQAINQLEKEKVDFKILSFHWGHEFINYPSPEQINDARYFIDMGADIIIGHHPHVVQGYEKYKHGYIFYSLGNFLFDMIWSKQVKNGLIVKLTVQENKSISKVVTIPTRLDNNFNLEKSPNLTSFNRQIKSLNGKIQRSKSNTREYYLFSQYYRIRERILMKVDLISRWRIITEIGKKQFYRNILSKLAKGEGKS